jgi:hypothetical protein
MILLPDLSDLLVEQTLIDEMITASPRSTSTTAPCGSVRTEIAELGRMALLLVFLQRKHARGALEPVNCPSCPSTEIAQRPNWRSTLTDVKCDARGERPGLTSVSGALGAPWSA